MSDMGVTSQNCTAIGLMAAMTLLVSSPKDECAQNPCGPLHYCENLPNGYACSCLNRRLGNKCGKQCPDSYNLWNSICMKIVQVKKNWWNARRHCHKDGGDLAILSDRRAYNYSMALLNDLKGKQADLHIGAFKDRGRWKWMDGKPLDHALWYPGQPDNFLGPQNCVGLYVMKMKDKDKYFLLDDVHCRVRHSFICQVA